MSDALKPGMSTTRRFDIDEGRTISFMGDEGRVYATPSLVLDIEQTCRDFLLEHLPAGEDSVGTRIAINHTAATPLGMWVDITATITAVEGRAVTFEITARDALDDICAGKHHRFIVNVEQTQARLRKKIEKAGLS